MILTLLAAPPSPDLISILGLVVFVCIVIVVFGVFLFKEEQRKRRLAESHVEHLVQQAKDMGPPVVDRDSIMFAQHKQMNDLQIAKLTAEVELLQNQVKAKTLDEDRIEASKEYHELMVEKTRLEMDTLRLHLMELRKRARTEDWRDE